MVPHDLQPAWPLRRRAAAAAALRARVAAADAVAAATEAPEAWPQVVGHDWWPVVSCGPR